MQNKDKANAEQSSSVISLVNRHYQESAVKTEFMLVFENFPFYKILFLN